MYPILFTINDISVYALGTCMVIGFIAFNAILIRLARKKKLTIKFWNNHIISLVIATVIGSRLFYVLAHIDRFQDTPKNILVPDGFSFYGGIIAFLILLHIYTKKQKEDLLGWLDVFTVSFFAWLIFSGIGHFLDGSNFGIPTDLPWGMTFDALGSPVTYTVPIHPTQLYESLYALILFLILYHLLKISKRKGLVTFIGGFFLGTCDFFINYLLGENTTMLGPLRMDQIIALSIIAITSAMLFTYFLKKQEI